MQNKNKKILLTGGHAATVALATVEEIQKQDKNWKLYWIGPKSAIEGGMVPTAAEKILSEFGVKVIKISTGRLKKRGSLVTRLISYVKVPLGFFHAFYNVLKINPTAIVSFGGFASFPVVFAGWILRKPILIQEQIVGAGLANKLAAPFANKIAVSSQESMHIFPKNKTILIGNPQVSNMFAVAKNKTLHSPPVLLITGGSSGSEIINEVVEAILPKLLEKYTVIHQVGDKNIQHFVEVKNNLDDMQKSRYDVFGYVNPFEMADNFSKADIVVSRAGANTVSDILITKRPAILIPIPWSIGNEQMKNALKAKELGICSILEQDNLSGKNLLEEISNLITNWEQKMRMADLIDTSLNKSASSNFVALIEDLV